MRKLFTEVINHVRSSVIFSYAYIKIGLINKKTKKHSKLYIYTAILLAC